MTLILAAIALLGVCIGDINAFSTPPRCRSQRQPIIITSTSHFGGGGFGASKSKVVPSKKKTKKPKKSKSAGFLDELEVSTSSSSSRSASQISSSSPKLDRFGLPVPTEEDIFPPLAPDITRIPSNKDHDFNREEVADAIKNHLGINLNVFDEDGLSMHREQNGKSSESTQWSLNQLHKDPPVFQIDNFLTEEECESYKSMVEPNDNEPPKAFQITSPTFSSLSISRRTSTTWFCKYDGVTTLLSKGQQLLSVGLSQMEEPQIVRYRTGEEFSWHYDEIPSTQLSNGGQRLATLLVYLNDMEEGSGGGTVFRDLSPPTVSSRNGKRKRSKGPANSNTNQLTVRPKMGTALLFFPSYKDGTPDVRTLHKGEVALDTKMIAQLWIHEREYRAAVPEGNRQTDAMDGVKQEAARLGFL
eukprot:CAMPEP_0181123802 /NCGR_PEP_ID=MMETSP1071-20121207/26114_1 /TAXON_ID=35127 /ORGANISM="Thalassiosira sp., Strain NH16" /LENGTH=414 /DNA_ID=CAMNT_0023209009 /DNA_START=89 /DNA_END=1333 /DNA_ORIENTATION=+